MNTVNDTHYRIEPGQSWEVDLFRPEDAQGVTRLFLSVYGKGYPIRTYIDPKVLVEENAAGRTISSVARTPKGDIVGHDALFQSAPFKGIYEAGAGVVHSDYRGGKGIFTGLVAHGLQVGEKRFGVEAVYGESVCNHVFSQKMCRSLGCITHAVEVDLMPAAAYAKEQSASGRVASLLDFISLRPRPHKVYLPARYEAPLRFIYADLDDSRDLAISGEPFAAQSSTRVVPQYFDFAQVARLAVWSAGEDFDQVLEAQEKDVRDRGAVVIQAWLNLSEPWVGRAAEILRAKGYFLGGVLPRWFDQDGLLMAKICHRPFWEEMKIFFDRGRRIVEISRQDWEDMNRDSKTR